MKTASKESKNLLLTYRDQWEKTVYKPFFYRHLKELRQAESLEAFLSKFQEIEKVRAYSFSLWYLERYPTTEKRLRDKLSIRHLSDEAIGYALDRCKHYGYLQDNLVALSHLKRELMKGYGRNMVSLKIKAKLGLSDELLDDLWEREDVKELLMAAEEKARDKIIRRRGGEDERVIRLHLRRRGFY